MNKKRIFTVLYFLLLLCLSYSAILSGLFYQYDNDELSHAQYTYLINSGFTPYTSFIMTFTPLFYWFLSPLFLTFGFNFSGVFAARIVMVILFLIRILFSYLIVRQVFGMKIALIFVPVFLLGTFTVFSGMQIRNDNLMLTLFLSALWLFIMGFRTKNKLLFFFSGVLFSASCLVLLKIAPSLFVISFMFLVYVIRQKNLNLFLSYLAGLLIPILFFLVFFLLKGSLLPMFQQVLLDRAAYNSSLLNPSSFWFYYKPGNFYLFGLSGKPLTWFFEVLLVPASITGALMVLVPYVKNPKYEKAEFQKLLFAALLFSQFFWITTVNGVFAQYFLTLSYLQAIFSSVLLARINKYLLFALFLIFSIVQTKANLQRSAYGNAKNIERFSKIWAIIPKNEKTFPNTLFRPISYPLVYGAFIGDAPKKVLKRWPPIFEYLEKDKVKYLLLDSYSLQFIDPGTLSYINGNYYLDPGTLMWRRISK